MQERTMNEKDKGIYNLISIATLSKSGKAMKFQIGETWYNISRLEIEKMLKGETSFAKVQTFVKTEG